jgi:sporulation protein YlmC with PRC-barrel domain
MGRRGGPRRALALHKANALTGTKVVGDGGQQVGKIKDLLLDADQGTLSYVLITADNGSSQCVPVPWQMMLLRKDGKVARVKLSPDQFRDAPHADTSQISEKLGADQFNQRIHDYWSDKTPMAMPAHGNPIKLTELIGKSVKTPDGNRVGDIEDIVFAVQPGELIYALVSLSDQQQDQDRMAAVPFERVSARPNRDTARIDADPRSIQRMSYRADQEPDFGSRQFARRTQQQFDTDYVVYGVAVYDLPDRQRDAGTWQQSDRWSRFRRRRATGDSRSDLQGTIQSVGTFRPEQADWQSVRLKIETEDGQTRTVLVGPKERVEDRFDLERGDQVRLRGRPARIDGRRVIIARQFSMQDGSQQDDR